MKKYNRRIKKVEFSKDTEKIYTDAIEQNTQKRDKATIGSKEWELYNLNIEKLESELNKYRIGKIKPRETKIQEKAKPEVNFMKSQEIFQKMLEISKKVKVDTPKSLKDQPNIEEQKSQPITFSEERRISEEIDKLIKNAESQIEAVYLGNKQFDKRYDLAMKRYKDNITKRDFEFEKDGKRLIGTYQTVIDYEERDEDEETLRFSQYKEILERSTKAEYLKEKGIDLYEGTEFSYEKDKKYLETDNYTYNGYKQTRESLKTLGYFGKKSRLLELKKGQNIRNIARMGINISGFVRNHTIVPVSEIIGKQVAVRLFDISHKVLSKNKNKVYKGRKTHRYEARKKYQLSKGNGYIKSVYTSIIRAKKIDREIIENKKREVREEYEKYRNELLGKKRNIRKPHIKIDPISIETHNERNMKNVTRVITGIKMVAIAGFTYLGPRISKVILDKTSHERIITTETVGKDRIIQTQKWIEGKDIKVFDKQRLENLKIGDLIGKDDRSVARFAGGTEDFISSEKLEYIRGIAEGKLSMIDGNGVNISGMANGKIPTGLLNSSGNINIDTNILDLIAANRNQTLGTNIDKQQIMDEILKSGTPEQQVEKLQNMFSNIHFAKSSKSTGVPTGWDSLDNEFQSISQSFIKTVKGQGHWKTVTKTIKGKTIEKINIVCENSDTVERILGGLSSSLKAVKIGEMLDLIYENTRKPRSQQNIGER